ncbi:DNA-methyltransferase [Paenibacillus sp. JDR-2]|uniref:DNA-methyltransferase n=1 Tax=Paenibacillus sp. (strain JDR-2) TaxID=324057 RepID=UPI000166A731|nr:site-specific DNA-methyltransferase [Paenibacillus sp. JDR-2]ACT00271.1 DNA methylase N-4/N-6 domain protein [Paenibacillus sp. JDR-2]
MILHGDCRTVMASMEPEQFHTCVTSPPYWGLRDYGIPGSDWPEVTYTPMAGLPQVTVPAWNGCLGLEPTPEMFVAHSVLVFREVWRLLRPEGTLWMNYGDSYAKSGLSGMGDPTIGERNLGGMKAIAKSIPIGLKPKDLIGIPWRVAFALQADGWYLRMDNIWNKPNCMPESVKDRPTKAHEYMFLLSKSDRYYYDAEAIKEQMNDSSIARLSQDVENQQGSDRANGGSKKGMKAVGKAYSFARNVNEGKVPGQVKQHRTDREDVEYYGTRNKRSVWTVATAQFTEAHFATFPEKLIEPCILAGAPVDGKVLDPFGGSGTTLKVALENNRECTIIELGEQYVEIAERRTATLQPKLCF